MQSAATHNLVKPAVQKKILRRRFFNTDNIIGLVQEVIQTDYDDTAVLARQYAPTYDGLRQMFYDASARFEYEEDPPGNQWVQTPSYLYHNTKKGDCKSFTVYISSILKNMGISHVNRYTNYDRRFGRTPKHVYTVAFLPNGRKVTLDLAYHKQEGAQFDQQKPYTFKIDKFMKGGLYKLGSTSQQMAESAGVNIKELEKVMADVPDSIVTDGPGDVTAMTSGQLDRIIVGERFQIYARQSKDPFQAQKYKAAAAAVHRGSIAGIGSLANDPLGREVQLFLSKTARDTAQAFGGLNIEMTAVNQIAGLRSFLKKIGKGAKKVVKKVVSTVTDLFKKFVNWIWKGPAKKMAPYYLFLWVKNPPNKEVARRKAQQQKTFDFIAKAGKFSSEKLRGKIWNSIREKFNKNPEDIIKDASKIGAITAFVATAIEAIGWIVKIVKKIVGLFKSLKSKDAGNISKDNASDTTLLEGNSRSDTRTRSQNPATRKPKYDDRPPVENESSGGGMMAAALAALGIGIYALT